MNVGNVFTVTHDRAPVLSHRYIPLRNLYSSDSRVCGCNCVFNDKPITFTFVVFTMQFVSENFSLSIKAVHTKRSANIMPCILAATACRACFPPKFWSRSAEAV